MTTIPVRTPATRKKARTIIVIIMVTAAAGLTVWRLSTQARPESVDPAMVERANKIQSEIQDYSPPEQNVPNTAPQPATLQPPRTRQPQRVN
jgi:hypothetical protein